MPYLHGICESITSDLIRKKRKKKIKNYTNEKSEKYKIKDQR